MFVCLFVSRAEAPVIQGGVSKAMRLKLQVIIGEQDQYTFAETETIVYWSHGLRLNDGIWFELL